MENPSCEATGHEIKPGDMCSYDSVNGVYLSEEATATYREMLDSPESFWDGLDEDGNEIYLDKHTVMDVIQRHLDAGGCMDDKVGLKEYQP